MGRGVDGDGGVREGRGDPEGGEGVLASQEVERGIGNEGGRGRKDSGVRGEDVGCSFAGRVPVSGGVNGATSFSEGPPSHRHRREMVAGNARRQLRPSLSNVSVKRRVREKRKRLGHRANRSRGLSPPLVLSLWLHEIRYPPPLRS